MSDSASIDKLGDEILGNIVDKDLDQGIDETLNCVTPHKDRKEAGMFVCETCSICWSPMCKPLRQSLSLPTSDADAPSSPSTRCNVRDIKVGKGQSTISAPEDNEIGENIENQNQIVNGCAITPVSAARSSAAKGSTQTTRCGHTFHSKCLFQSKMRKAECPNCRGALTPITATHMSGVLDSLPAATATASVDTVNITVTEAVVHAAHRARNSVRAAIAAKERERERAREQIKDARSS